MTLDCSTSYISILQINCRSLAKKFDHLKLLLQNFKNAPTIISLAETWCHNSNEAFYSLPGYNLATVSRLTKRGGGVGVYVLDSWSLSVRKEYSNTKHKMYECLVLELSKAGVQNILLASIYRPPGLKVSLFMEEFSTLLQELTDKSNKYVIVSGDFNIDMLSSTNRESVSFMNLMLSSGVYPMVDKPTRITDHSSTLIDYIFISGVESNNFSKIIHDDLSDHLPVIAFIQIANSKCIRRTFFYSHVKPKRNFNAINTSNFSKLLSQHSWDNIYSKINNNENPNEIFDLFHTDLLFVFNCAFPMHTSPSDHKQTEFKNKSAMANL